MVWSIPRREPRRELRVLGRVRKPQAYHVGLLLLPISIKPGWHFSHFTKFSQSQNTVDSTNPKHNPLDFHHLKMRISSCVCVSLRYIFLPDWDTHFIKLSNDEWYRTWNIRMKCFKVLYRYYANFCKLEFVRNFRCQSPHLWINHSFWL